MLLKKEIVYFRVEGFNFDKFLKEAKKNNIELHSLKRLQHNLFFVGVYVDQKEGFLQLTTRLNLKAIQQSQTKFLSFKTKLKQNVAIFMCAIMLSFIVGFLNNFVFKIEIVGLEKLSQEQVISVLNDNNISVGKFKSTYNLDNIELILKNSLEKVSLASAIIKGNTLIVSINEKIDNSEYVYDYKPIIAPYDMVIKDVKLKSGTVVKQKNQTVKKGEAIVLPYIEYKDGTQLSVEAQAEIVAHIELSTTYYYMENHEEQVLSGKSYQVVEYSLFNKSWVSGKNSSNKNPFVSYKTIKSASYVFNDFLIPIKKIVTIYKELIPKQVYKPFTPQIEQKIIEENKKVLYNNLSKESKVKDVEYLNTTNFVDNMFLVTTYLKADITF